MENTFDILKDRFGTLKEAARKIGVPYNTFYDWSKRGQIPEREIPWVREKAKEHGVVLP